MKKILFLFITALFPIVSFTQSFSGFSYGNYSGIQGVLHNSANVVDSPYKFSSNILSVSTLANNDYVAIDLKALIKGNDETSDGSYFDPSSKHTTPTSANNFNINVDILGPSMMLNINKNNAVALYSRARIFSTISDIDGTLYSYFEDNFENNEDYNIAVDNASITTHAWAEFGLSYGHMVTLDNNSFLKIGTSVKYLKGLNVAHASLNNFTADYTAASNTISTTGEIAYGTNLDYESDSYDFSKGASGFSFDIGTVLQWGNKSVLERKNVSNFKRYTFRLGLSITDIGKLSYSKAELTTYNTNKDNISIDDIEGDNLGDTFESIYTGQGSQQELQIKLPTAAHINVDWSINNSFYLNLNTDLPLSKRADNANRIVTNYTLTPRFESKWLSIYSPVNYGEFQNFGWGVGFRLGPLLVGSSTIFSSLMSPTKKADVHVGLRLGLFKKSKSQEEIAAKQAEKDEKKLKKENEKLKKKEDKDAKKAKN